MIYDVTCMLHEMIHDVASKPDIAFENCRDISRVLKVLSSSVLLFLTNIQAVVLAGADRLIPVNSWEYEKLGCDSYKGWSVSHFFTYVQECHIENLLASSFYSGDSGLFPFPPTSSGICQNVLKMSASLALV